MAERLGRPRSLVLQRETEILLSSKATTGDDLAGWCITLSLIAFRVRCCRALFSGLRTIVVFSIGVIGPWRVLGLQILILGWWIVGAL